MGKIEERYKIIELMMHHHGIEYGDHIFISLWDLASNIANTWNSDKFVDPEKHPEWFDDFHGRPVLKSHRYYEMFKAIRQAVKPYSDIEIRKSYNNKTEYLLK